MNLCSLTSKLRSAILVCLMGGLFPVTARTFERVLLITVDTLRSDYVGYSRSGKVRTPNIDTLAASGVVFQTAVAPAPYTLPSHTSLLTGLIPPAHGVHDNGRFVLDKRYTTLAEILLQKKTKTAAFVAAFPVDSRFGLDQGFELYEDGYEGKYVSEIVMPERNAERVVDSALNWMRKQQDPWFAWIHFYDPHFPYNPPEKFKQQYSKDPYAGEVAYVDEQIGRLLDFLRTRDGLKNTLVVLTSDHGESLGEHREKTHGIFAYESTLRIPLVMAPFKQRTVSTRVRLIDVAPTILELQGATFPKQMQGSSLVKFLKGETIPQTDSYFESLSMTFNARWAPLRGFYSENFKFIDLPIPELYDVEKDPKESTNLCSDQALCKDWSTKFTQSGLLQSAVPTLNAPIDRETAEQLEALGYLSKGKAEPQQKYEARDDPKNLIALQNRIEAAITFFRKGYDLKAIELLDGVIEERRDYAMAYEYASYIWSASGFPDRAVETLEKAVANGISNPDLMGKLGLYLYETNHYDKALERLETALQKDPRHIDNLNYLGIVYTALKRFEDAESSFQKALAINPTDSVTLENTGVLFLNQKKYDQAIRYLQSAVQYSPHLANAYNVLGAAHAGRGDWEKAIQNWTRALQENDLLYDALLNLAFAYLKIDDDANALKTFRSFEKNAPPARYAKDLSRVRSLIQELEQR